METLKFKSSRFWPLFGNLLFPAELIADTEKIVFQKKHLKIPWFGSWTFIGRIETTVLIKDIAYFDTSGVINKSIEFGYTDQIAITGVSKANADLLKKHVIKYESKIAQEGKSFKSIPIASIKDFINPKKWLLREKIILTEEAVIFNKRKFFSSKTTYLPYDKMSVGYFCGVFSKNVFILGEQNIIANYEFSNSCCKIIEKKIKEKGIQIAEGKSYRPFIFSSIRSMLFPKRLICTENEVVYLDILPFKPKVIKILRYNEIDKFKKSKWYSLIGTITISGSATNIRSDQDTSVFIEMKNMWFYRWRVFFISTGIRAFIKKHKN